MKKNLYIKSFQPHPIKTSKYAPKQIIYANAGTKMHKYLVGTLIINQTIPQQIIRNDCYHVMAYLVKG